MTTVDIETALAERTDENLELMVANLDLAVAGEENLHPGDIGMPPRLRISQQNRPIEDAPPGSIVNSLTGEVFQAGVDLVPLMFMPRTRVMWPEQFSATNDPLCASDDGGYPAASTDNRVLLDPQLGPCDACPFSKFGDDGTPPACKLQRNFLVMVLNGDMSPAILTLQSTSLEGARQFTTLAKTQGISKSIKFATRRVESDKGTWYVAAFAKGRKLEPREIIGIAEARDELKGLVVTADIERGNGHDVDDAGVEQATDIGDVDLIPF